MSHTPQGFYSDSVHGKIQFHTHLKSHSRDTDTQRASSDPVQTQHRVNLYLLSLFRSFTELLNDENITIIINNYINCKKKVG